MKPLSSPLAVATSSPPSSAAYIPDALATFDRLPSAAFVRLPVVCALLGIAPATAWRWVKRSKLPAPRKLSEAVTAWNVGELRKALNGEDWQ
jgi:predicted DNA-binding transcriptional regulator AlpA